MSRQSKETAAQIREMRKVQAEKMEEYFTEWGYDFCRGCLTSQPPIDWAHIIRQGLRPDLRADPDNNERLCRKCHLLGESLEFDKLLCGEQQRNYVERHEPRLLHIKPRQNAA